MKDPHDGREFLVPPGGAIEPNESTSEAAIRETFEETKCRVTIKPEPISVDRYLFRWNGKVNTCETTYFIATSLKVEAGDIDDASYNLGRVWLEVDKIEAQLETQGDINSRISALVKTHFPL